jgi:UDP-2,3-diacylglucosamine pyrophosphatase LpxH
MLYDLFARNNVNIVISGHSHRENDVDLEGVRYITTGAMENGEFGTCYVNKSGISFRFEDL